MFCEKCGGELRQEENKLICTKCGAEFSEENDVQASSTEYVVPRGFSSKRNIIIIVIAALLAIVTITTIVAVNSTNAVSQDEQSSLQLARRYLSEQKYEQAIIEFERVISINPWNVDAYLGMADAYIGMGEYDKAEEILRKGYEVTGDSALLNKINSLSGGNRSGDKECLEIEEMIEAYLRGEGEIDNSRLANVTGLTIYGTEIVGVECGSRIGTRLNGWSGTSEGGSTWTEQGEVSFSYGTIDSMHQDIPFVYEMPSLVKLSICFNPLSDIGEFTELGGLRELALQNDKFTDISGISKMSSLTSLVLWEEISNLSPLKSMTNLKALKIGSNVLEDISPLSEMTWLEELQIHINNEKALDASYLSSLTSLHDLYIFDNTVENASVIGNLVNLNSLNIQGWNITDYSFISRLSNLKSLDINDYNNMYHIDLRFASALSGLEHFWLHGGVNDISPIMELNNLKQLSIRSKEFIPDEQIEQFKKLHTDCRVDIEFTEDASASSGNESTEEPIELMEQTLHGNPEYYDTVQMISAYLRGEGEIDTSKLSGITLLHIWDYDGVGIQYDVSDYHTSTSITSSADCNGRIRSIEDIGFIFDMPDLKWLEISNQSIVDFSLEKMNSLENLLIYDTDLEVITELRGCNSLKEIFINCPNLREIRSISSASLERLSLENCVKLEILPDLSNAPALNYMDIECGSGDNNVVLTDISPISGAENLEILHISYCINLEDLSPISKLKNLCIFDAYNLEKLTDISPFSELEKLRSIRFFDCINLRDISPLGRIRYPFEAYFSSCAIDSIPQSIKGSGVNSIGFAGCDNLCEVSALAELSNAYSICFYDCANVTEEQVEYLRSRLSPEIVSYN